MKIPQFQAKSLLKFLLSILISILFLYLTISKVDFRETLKSFSDFNYFLIVPAIGLHMIAFFLRSVKWKVLVDNLKKVSLGYVYSITVIGFMFNNVLPFRIGEIARSHILGRDQNISRTSVLGTIFLEKVSDAAALLLLIVILGLSLSKSITILQNSFLIIFILIILIVIVCTAIVFEKKILLILEGLSLKVKRFSIISRLMKSFITGLSSIKSPSTLFKLAILSLIIWCMEALPYYVITLGFNFNLNFLQILFVCSIVNIGLLIPSSPGYIGTFHFFCVLALGAFGISANPALSYAIITHLILWLPITLVGLAFFIARRK